MMRKGMRLALVGVGLAIMAVGVPIALLPWLHLPGALILATGLVVVLRNSFSARRTFIRAQRRHPKIVFPIRRAPKEFFSTKTSPTEAIRTAGR